MEEYLSQNNVEFEVKDIAVDPDAVKELVETYNSRSTPTLVIGEEVMIGFDQGRLKELLEL